MPKASVMSETGTITILHMRDMVKPLRLRLRGDNMPT